MIIYELSVTMATMRHEGERRLERSVDAHEVCFKFDHMPLEVEPNVMACDTCVTTVTLQFL